ncbi:rho guanine nucleotide exchange factor 4 [Elysia marginata]|uniref:Rho guanine nucleotide exchange factor 4 n=1 Tax=Elysia marginata TaxID=1093978 RepID=A0AAV4EJL8_9GAST|nr:rho guanine nucleotide exchange factor 4 [Elysia marginata]
MMQGVVRRVTVCLEQDGQAVSEAAEVAAVRNAKQRLELKRKKFSEGRCLSTPHPITLRGEKPRPSTHPAASSSNQQRSNGSVIIPQDFHLNSNNSSSNNIITITDEADTTTTLGGLSSQSPAFSSSSSSDLATSSSAVSSEGGSGGGTQTLTSHLPSGRASQSRGAGRLARAHSMPENLDKLTRKRHFFGMLGLDSQGTANRPTSLDPEEDDADSSDDSEYSYSMSGGYRREKMRTSRSSHLMLAALDQMLEEENLTYAEALWDHVTMDPEELGFRAGDLIRVTDCQDKHWWFGVLDDTEGWFPAAFVRLRVNQDLMDTDLDFLLSAGGLSLAADASNLIDSNGNSFQSSADMLRHRGDGESTIQAQKVSGVSFTPGSKSGGYLDNHQARANVVNEIISAEREYVKHLRDVVEGYVKQASKRPEMFPVEKVKTIFSNIEDIYEFATELLAQLEESLNPEQPHLSELGRCFLNSIKSFEMYSDYCNNHPAACEELRELYRNKRYRHFFEACRLLQEMIEIPLEGFLLTPVQKICKYHLQLAELLKFTPPTHPDHAGTRDALEAMKRIATLINERKRKMESVEKLAAWQLLVDDWEGPDILESSSELIYSGELNKVNHAGWSQERYFFLFDHQLIYCKKDLLKKSGFGYKGRIYMDGCSVVSVPDGRDSQYNVSVRNAWKLHDPKRDKWYLLVAKTAVAKQRWLKAFQDERRRVKEDAENNFNIPSHVKEAVVTSFKQKANLNKPKGRTKFNRTNSTQSFSSYSKEVNAYATLPRNKGRHKVKVKLDDDDGGKGSISGGKKITRFFLGKGKS